MIFSVTVLGCGAATPLTNRNASSHLLNVHEKLYLIDCAEGTQVQLRRNRIRLQRINHIFISHLHGDHYFGLPGLIFTFHLLGRTKELHIFASPPMIDIIDLNLKVAGTTLNYPLIFHPLDPSLNKVIHTDKAVEVSTIPLNHDFPTCGFLFREIKAERKIRKDFVSGKDIPNEVFDKIKSGEDYIDERGTVFLNADITMDSIKSRSFAYCTDTGYHEPIIPIIYGVDLLFHESTFMEDKKQDAADKFHSTAAQAATIAKKAGVRKLLLGHYSARYKQLDGLLMEAQTVFPDSVLGEDGLTIDVESASYSTSIG